MSKHAWLFVVVAFLCCGLAAETEARAERRVDWSEYLEPKAPAKASPSRKEQRTAKKRTAASRAGKHKRKPAARTKRARKSRRR